jgi:hypothetical protein
MGTRWLRGALFTRSRRKKEHMKTYKSVSGFLLGAFALVLGACGGGETLSEAEATNVMQAASSATSSASRKVQGGLSEWGADGVKVDIDADHFSVEWTMESDSGGSAKLTGEGTTPKEGSFSVDLSVAFDDWKDNDLVLNGELDMSVTTSNSERSQSIEGTLNGELEVSGATNATVSFDLFFKDTISSSKICLFQSGEVGGVAMDLGTGCD